MKIIENPEKFVEIGDRIWFNTELIKIYQDSRGEQLLEVRDIITQLDGSKLVYMKSYAPSPKSELKD